MTVSRLIRAAVLVAFTTSPAAAQSMDDAVLLPTRVLSTGLMYSRDSWSEYWEGALKRTNGNIGALTTQSAMVTTGYGVTSRLTVLAMLPYVWTHASAGTLEGMKGVQDATIAAKFRALASDRMGLTAIVVAAAAFPASNYTPDFMPMSIGTGGSRASGRLTVAYQPSAPWFFTASGAYTFCNNVRLDRSAYYTNGQLYLTNQVAMPNVSDYEITAGLRRGRWELPVTLVQQHTLGGGDIRRQDMPFVSDRMDFTRLAGELRYALERSGNLWLRAGAAQVLNGRNVGQSTTLTSGLMYAFHL
jgi:hypothetical protein